MKYSIDRSSEDELRAVIKLSHFMCLLTGLDSAVALKNDVEYSLDHDWCSDCTRHQDDCNCARWGDGDWEYDQWKDSQLEDDN